LSLEKIRNRIKPTELRSMFEQGMQSSNSESRKRAALMIKSGRRTLHKRTEKSLQDNPELRREVERLRGKPGPKKKKPTTFAGGVRSSLEWFVKQ
jgi:hypothetical protein